MKRAVLTFVLLIASYLVCDAQKQNNQWRFGNGLGIDFNTTPPSLISTLPIATVEGSASVADRNTGALLFYTDGVTVWNSSNQVMPNGNALLGGQSLSSTTAAVIVPKPLSSTIYYIVTVDEQISSGGVSYSVVDMSLNNGLGDVVPNQKNVLLLNTQSEKLEVIPASDGQSFWLLTHDLPGNTFYAYKVTENGIQTQPVISSAGSVQVNGAGHMKINRQYNKLAMGETFGGKIELFDFNNTTGVVSNPIEWNSNLASPLIYGIEFSPDGNLLYVSNLQNLIQYNISEPTSTTIQNSALSLSSQLYAAATLQLGPDNKIYVNSGVIDVINCPNSLGVSCGLQRAVLGENITGGYGLPKSIFVDNKIPTYTSNSILKQGNCVGAPVAFSLASTTDVVSVEWNFGDATAGASNTSNSLTPQYTYSNAGTFTVNVLVNYVCFTENLTLTFTFSSLTVPTFNPIPAICQGTAPPVLPTTSINGILGTWSPPTISTTATGTYTFTPNAGQCVNAAPVQVTVVVNPSPAPTFAPIANSICANTIPPVLPTTSLNGIAGTWSPALVSNTASGIYTFTPNPGQCAATGTVQIAIAVVPSLTPEFAPIAPLCAGSAPPVLPATSLNGIVGTWSPSVVSNTATGIYTFTPNPGQCVSVGNVQVTITVNNVITPAFTPIPAICAGQAPPVLPTTSSNGITGTWSPPVVSTTASGIYTFTPGPGQCVTVSPVQIQVTVKTGITPQFQAIAPLCAGSAPPVLPTTSLNGIVGTWSPPLVNSQSSGIYTFTPNPSNEFCYNPVTVSITVNPRQNPGFENLELCRNQTNFSLNTTSPNGILGTWSPSAIDFDNGGSYTFTPNPGQCATPQTITVIIKENEIFNFDLRVSEPFEDSPTITIIPLSQGNYLYQLDEGIPQISNIFRDVSRGFHTVSIVDADGCSDDVVFEDVLIIDYPKFFTPNGDGINDTWNINPLFFQRNSKIYIFDRHGKLLTQIFPFQNGWDGTYNNARMKSDDYWFIVDYVYNNQPRQYKSHFSLKR